MDRLPSLCTATAEPSVNSHQRQLPVKRNTMRLRPNWTLTLMADNRQLCGCSWLAARAAVWVSPTRGRGVSMDVRQLEMFRAVVEEGSFTRAAVRLNVSQSAVSRQLQLLEAELGGPLLHRSVKGVTLTAEGELLLRTANRIHRDIREAVWEISETQKLKRGQLRIAGGGTVCLY